MTTRRKNGMIMEMTRGDDYTSYTDDDHDYDDDDV